MEEGPCPRMGTFNVHVTAFRPTLIRTELNRFIQNDPIAFGQMVARIPLGRAGEVQDEVGFTS